MSACYCDKCLRIERERNERMRQAQINTQSNINWLIPQNRCWNPLHDYTYAYDWEMY